MTTWAVFGLMVGMVGGWAVRAALIRRARGTLAWQAASFTGRPDAPRVGLRGGAAGVVGLRARARARRAVARRAGGDPVTVMDFVVQHPWWTLLIVLYATGVAQDCASRIGGKR